MNKLLKTKFPSSLLLGLFGLALLQSSPVLADEDEIAEVEATLREYYDTLETLDYDAARALSTAEFEILDRGYRYGHPPFRAQFESAKEGGFSMLFNLQDFRTRVVGDVAWSSVVTIRPNYRFDGLDAFILRRIDGRWLVDRFVHLRMLDGTDPHRVPGGQKPPEQIQRQQ